MCVCSHHILANEWSIAISCLVFSNQEFLLFCTFVHHWFQLVKVAWVLFLEWSMHDKVSLKKMKHMEFSWNLKASIERPLHCFSWWWWMDQVFGSPISLKDVSFWYFVIKAKLGLWPWSLVVMCDVHQHSPCIIFTHLLS